MKHLVLGGPGAGKTSRLIEIAEAAIASGVQPARIAYLAFTRAAAYEARDRACTRFGLDRTDLPYFRTLHSCAYHALGMRRSQVVGAKHLAEVEELTGEELSEEDRGVVACDNLSRTTLRPLEETWRDFDELDWWRTRRFAEAYRNYKVDNDVADFTDMLRDYLDGPCPPFPVDVAVVDEAQDLSRLQWAVVEKAFGNAREIYYGGDDDQSIHEWAGADRQHFLHVRHDLREVLPRSHRLPTPVFDLAQSIIVQTTDRYHKDIVSAGKPGRCEWVGSTDDVDLSSGSWLLLGRSRYQLEDLARVARDQGVPYSVNGVPAIDQDILQVIRDYEGWRAGGFLTGVQVRPVLACMGIKRKVDDGQDYAARELGVDVGTIWHNALSGMPLGEREFILAARRSGESLLSKPRVDVGTIHSSKGREADNVLLLTDMTARIRRAFDVDPDPETRVWYVGVTRASQNLFLVQPRTRHGFQM